MALEPRPVPDALLRELSEQRWDVAQPLLHKEATMLRLHGAARSVIDVIRRIPPLERTIATVVLLARTQSQLDDNEGALLTLQSNTVLPTTPAECYRLHVCEALIRDYLNEAPTAIAMLTPLLQVADLPADLEARVWSWHAGKLVTSDPEAAQAADRRAITAASRTDDLWLQAGMYSMQAERDGLCGRLSQAEQGLRQADCRYRDLDNPTVLATVLKSRAMVKLAQAAYDEAMQLAQEGRMYALKGEQYSWAATASATCGDVALAQGLWQEAADHYQTAVETAERAGYWDMRTYSWAMLAHLAHIQHDVAAASRLLRLLRQQSSPSRQTRMWVMGGTAAAQHTLGQHIDDQVCAGMLDEAQGALPEARTALAIMWAQAVWYANDQTTAQVRWQQVEQHVQAHQAAGCERLAPLAAATPSFVRGLAMEANNTFAQLACTYLDAPLATPPSPPTAPPCLVVRVFGTEPEVWWQGVRVPDLPARASQLLVLLALTKGAARSDAIIAQLWGNGGARTDSLRKMADRLKHKMPGAINQTNQLYSLGPQPHEVVCDVVEVLTVVEIATLETALLHALAQRADAALKRHSDAPPWGSDANERLRVRVSRMWAELGRRSQQRGDHDAAADAYVAAHQLDAASEPLTQEVLQWSLDTSARPQGIACYRAHRNALDPLGIEPITAIEDLYFKLLNA